MTPGNNSDDGYGETATTSVDHTGGGGYDCVTWNAIVFSTAIEDVDHDGLPDALENAAAGAPLKDPNSQTLPDLSGMGATTSQQDMFVEVNGMWAPPGTTYGSWVSGCDAVEALTNKFCAPFNAGAVPQVNQETDEAGHHHIPSHEVLNDVAETFGARGIKVHFDVGPDLGEDYAPTTTVPNRFVQGDECSRRGDHRRDSV